MSPLDVSIIIPAYNEENRLPLSIQKIKKFLNKQQLNFEIIIVVEKSTDQTARVAKREIKKDQRFKLIVNNVHKGKGYAVKQGMLIAKGKYLFFMDADLSTSLNDIKHFLNHFVAHPGIDVIIGSREHPKSNIVLRQNVIRRRMGKVFNYFVQQLVYPGIKDTQCGFKAYRYSVAQQLFSLQTIDGFSFDVENLALAQKLNYKIAVLPVVWKNSAGSRVQIFSGSWQMLKDLYKIRINLKNSFESSMISGPVQEKTADIS
jgi:dolichyl-phosphate beta-glucosyltransferase